MSSLHTRRSFLRSSAGLIAGGSLVALVTAPLRAETPAAPAQKAPAKPPVLPADQVQAVVSVAHRSLDKVRELVEATPLLANACWDWGGGDFETPLQAAAHTGGHEIAEYLLSKHARLDVYAAAMLGRLDFIKATFALDPEVHLIPGPHGFTLLHCAKQGGERARPVLEWMRAQGVPEVFFRPLPFVWPPGTAP